MVVYACPCLNVRIFAERPKEEPVSDAVTTCPLAPSCEFIELIDQGFQFTFKCLVHRAPVGEWTVYVCTPCHMRTHAVHHKERLVVVSTDMQKGDETIQIVKKKPDYSPVFGLYLNPADGKPKTEDGIQPQTYETLQAQLAELQQTLSQYLKLEEEAMEKRIKDFEDEQRNAFARKKKKAQEDKNSLTSILFHNSEGERRMTAAEKSVMKAHAPLTHSKSANEYVRDIPNYQKKGKMQRRIRDSSPDVFAMDELEIDEEEEEDENTAPSSRSESQMRSENRNILNVQQYGQTQRPGLDTTEELGSDAPLMSTSVPISMPVHARNLRNPSYLDDDIEESAEFDDIPRHMQALSESIQERDRYIFGDRPRQRVHTGDFTQVNWH